jgi:hypothetical protein
VPAVTLEPAPEVKSEPAPEDKPETPPEVKPETPPEDKPEIPPEDKPETPSEDKPQPPPETKPQPAAAPPAPASLTPEQRKRAYLRTMLKAKKALKKGDLAVAETLVRRALELRETSRARSVMGSIYEKTDRLELAIQQLRKAAELESDVAWFQDKLGRLYVQKGDKQQACQAFRAALKIAPKYGSARRNLKQHCR